MARTPQEIFEHHATVLIAGDIEGIVSDYADDALIITPQGVLRESYSNCTWQNATYDAAGKVARGERGRLFDLGLSLGLFVLGLPATAQPLERVVTAVA